MQAATALTVRPRPRRISRIDRAMVGRLVLGIVAIAVAVFAQGYLERRTFLVDAGLLILIAAVLFARAARGTLAIPPVQETVPLPAPLTDRRPHPGTALIVAGIVLNLSAIGLFILKSPNLAWALYLLSMPVSLVGAYVLDSRPSLREVLRRNLPVLVVLAALTGIALLLRIVRVAELPYGFWADEAFHGLEVLKILREPEYRPIVGTGPSQGLPAGNWYVMVPFFILIGPSEMAVRLPSVLAGAAGVGALFLLGRALFGTTVGLISAGLIATLAWHLTLSRIGFNAVQSVVLNAACLAFLIFGLRTGRRSMFALAGLCLGMGQNFYYSSRLFVAVVGFYLLHQLVSGRLPWLRRNLAGLALFSVMALISGSPILYVAIENPRLFTERQETVSIQKEIAQAGSLQPLYSNIQKHLLMFNVQGDGNGRHNLPGAPMLERVAAALAVLGLLIALTRARRAEFAVLPVWLIVMLLGGILTLAFEAPQSLRAADAMVPATILAALPLASVAQRIIALGSGASTRLFGWVAPRGVVAAGVVVAIPLLVTGVGNIDRYFVRQASTFAVWANHATPETIIGREISHGRTVGKVYIDQVYMEQPTIRFLAPTFTPHRQFEASSTLPVRDPEGATIFVQPDRSAAVTTIRRLYPDAVVKEYRSPAGSPPALFEVLIPPEVAARVQGVEVRYWPGSTTSGSPLRVERASTVEIAKDAMPLAPPFVAEWKGVLTAPLYGRYAFKLEGPPTAVLKVDETELTTGGKEAAALLARGNHALTVMAPVDAPEAVRLLWRRPNEPEYTPVPSTMLFATPVTNNGLLGLYYRGLGWQGEPGLQQIDPTMSMRFHILPLPRPYSVEWRGKVYAPTDGSYRFGTNSVDESWIYIDERLVVDNSRGNGQYVEGGMTLSAGFHDIRIRYVDRTGHTFIEVYWVPPGRAQEPIPTEVLFPPQGSYPDRVVLPPVIPISPPPAADGSRPAAAPAAKPSKPIAVVPGTTQGGVRLSATLTMRFGSQGDDEGEFNQPRAVAADKEGNLYVADFGNRRIQKFDASGRPLATWPTGPDLAEPVGIVVDSGGRVLVLGADIGWIKRFTPDGKLIDQFGGPDGRFYHPRGLSIDAADNLYVADTGGSRVVKFNGAGQQVAVFGERGAGPGQITEPTGVAADPSGRMWVADSANSKIVRFNPAGQAEAELPLPKSGSFNGPHVALDVNGNAYVTDPEGGQIIVVGSDGVLRGAAPIPDGRKPVGIGMTADGKVLVADVDIHQVFVLAPFAP